MMMQSRIRRPLENILGPFDGFIHCTLSEDALHLEARMHSAGPRLPSAVAAVARYGNCQLKRASRQLTRDYCTATDAQSACFPACSTSSATRCLVSGISALPIEVKFKA